MATWIWLAIIAVISAVFVCLYKRLGKQAHDEITKKDHTLQLQHSNYEEWKFKATERATSCSEMQMLIFRLIAERITSDIQETLVYTGAEFVEEDKVILYFESPLSQYQKASMNRYVMLERLRLFNKQWDFSWFPTLDCEIQREKRSEAHVSRRFTEVVKI